MSTFSKKQVLLTFGLMLSVLSVVASNYQYKRLNGRVMPSTGESKMVTIEIPVSKVPLYVFLDYNGQIPLSQRLEISAGQSKAQVTLLPVSQLINVSVVPQAELHTYLNAMEKYNAEKMQEKQKAEALMDKGVQIINLNIINPNVTSGHMVGNMMVDSSNQAVERYQNLQRATKRIANIMYEKITHGQVVSLPNPFEEVKPEEPIAAESDAEQSMMQPSISDIENQDKDMQESAEVSEQEPTAEENPEIEQHLMQFETPTSTSTESNISESEMSEPEASDMGMQDKDSEKAEIASSDVEDESVQSDVEDESVQSDVEDESVQNEK